MGRHPLVSDKGGIVIASSDASNIAIARWPAGAFTVGGGPRVFFAGGLTDYDTYNLTALGAQVFLNVIRGLWN